MKWARTTPSWGVAVAAVLVFACGGEEGNQSSGSVGRDLDHYCDLSERFQRAQVKARAEVDSDDPEAATAAAAAFVRSHRAQLEELAATAPEEIAEEARVILEFQLAVEGGLEGQESEEITNAQEAHERVRSFERGACSDYRELLRVPSEAMEPTFAAGETIELDPRAYDDTPPKPGDVIVHNPPRSAVRIGGGSSCAGQEEGGQQGSLCAEPGARRASELFIKRVVAGGGDRVGMKDGQVMLNGEAIAEPYISRCSGQPGVCTFRREITVPKGTVYVLGDNRGASDDSRFFGPVPLEWVVGRIERVSGHR